MNQKRQLNRSNKICTPQLIETIAQVEKVRSTAPLSLFAGTPPDQQIVRGYRLHQLFAQEDFCCSDRRSRCGRQINRIGPKRFEFYTLLSVIIMRELGINLSLLWAHQIFSGSCHNFAITQDTSVLAWGNNGNRQLGVKFQA